MALVLGTVALFILIGVSSRRFGWRQQTLVVMVSIALAVVQFRFSGVL